MWCEVADDPVVVNKSRPVKAGNRLEDKTATTSSKVVEVNTRVSMDTAGQKPEVDAKG